jgi:hypothetical protein
VATLGWNLPTPLAFAAEFANAVGVLAGICQCRWRSRRNLPTPLACWPEFANAFGVLAGIANAVGVWAGICQR